MSSVRHWQLIYCSLLFRASENGTLLHPSLLIIFVGKKKVILLFLQTQQNIKMIFFSLLNSSTFSEFLWSINLRYILKQWDNKCPTNSKYILDDSSNLTMQRGPRSMFRPHVQVSWRRSSCFVFSNHSMRNQNYLLRQWHIDHCFRTIGSHNTTIPHSIKRSTDFLLFFQLECHHCRKWIVFFFYAHEIQKRVERPVK